MRFDDDRESLWLSSIFKWYQADFGGLEAVLELVRLQLRDPEFSEKIGTGQFRVRYIGYDWSVKRPA